jgi:methionine biosynthesis protein MetW
MADNRRYEWKDDLCERPEYPIIVGWVARGSRVLDLGCGNGSLLRVLRHEKAVRCAGIELSPSGVIACQAHQLEVRQGSIDEELAEVPTQAIDYAICNVTLQMVMRPEVTLREMARVARFQIVSFPNFAYLANRLELMLLGRMPRRGLFGYDWYDTGHIHQLSVADLLRTIRPLGLVVRDAVYLGAAPLLARLWPNLFATEAILLLERAP